MRTDVYNEDMPAVSESKGSEKDEKPISSAIFAKSKNFKPGIYVNRAYKWIPGYGIFIKPILRGKMAFDTMSRFDHVIKLCMAVAYLMCVFYIHRGLPWMHSKCDYVSMFVLVQCFRTCWE